MTWTILWHCGHCHQSGRFLVDAAFPCLRAFELTIVHHRDAPELCPMKGGSRPPSSIRYDAMPPVVHVTIAPEGTTHG